MNFKFIFKSFAFIGSTILILCFIPQILKIYKNKSAKDVSFSWIILSIIGMIFVAIYSLYFKLWEIFFPLIIQIFLYSIIGFCKKYYQLNPVIIIKSVSDTIL